MARPPASDLTGRELEVMQVFWALGEATIAEVRDALAVSGPDLAYTTVATLVRIVAEKGFVTQMNEERPYRYRPARSYEEVSGRLLRDVLDRVFRGSREQLLVRLMEEGGLSAKERAVLEQILRTGEEKP
jgi:predicted transcriptional regulator